MRELELKFNGKGSMKPFRFQQISKGNDAYIYMVEIIENPSIRWYEVFRRRECSDTDVVLTVRQFITRQEFYIPRLTILVSVLLLSDT